MSPLKSAPVEDSISAVVEENVQLLHRTHLPMWHPILHADGDQITFRHLLTTKVTLDVKIFNSVSVCSQMKMLFLLPAVYNHSALMP